MLIELANATGLTVAEEGVIDECCASVRTLLAEGTPAEIRDASAELNGLYGLYNNQFGDAAQDAHMLVATDTELGRRCAALVEEHLRSLGFTTVFCYIPEGLTAADTASFEKGSKALIHECARLLRLCQMACVTGAPPDLEGHTVLKEDGELVESLFPVWHGHGPFFGDAAQGQKEQLYKGLIGRQGTACL